MNVFVEQFQTKGSSTTRVKMELLPLPLKPYIESTATLIFTFKKAIEPTTEIPPRQCFLVVLALIRSSPPSPSPRSPCTSHSHTALLFFLYLVRFSSLNWTPWRNNAKFEQSSSAQGQDLMKIRVHTTGEERTRRPKRRRRRSTTQQRPEIRSSGSNPRNRKILDDCLEYING